MKSAAPGAWARRLWLVLLLLPLLWLLQSDVFGLFPKSRTLTWRLPVPSREVRKLELQVWDSETLLKKEELLFPSGLTAEPVLQVALSSGASHRAIATVWLADATSPLVLQQVFNPGAEETLILEMKKAATSH